METEEDVKIKIVLAWLKELGFSELELKFERTLTLRLGRAMVPVGGKRKKQSKTGRYDILVSRKDTNLFVVEVKAPDEKLTDDDRDQAISYARLVHPIAPFALVTNGGDDWRLYDSITKDLIPKSEFVFKDKYSIELPDEARYEALKSFLGYSSENLLAFCEWQVNDYMKELVGSPSDRTKKYIRELFEPWEELDRFFEGYLKSSAPAFIVGGDSGKGKTCWACHTALRYLADGFPTLFYRGHNLRRGLFSVFGSDLNWELSSQLLNEEGPKRFFDIFQDRPTLVFMDGLESLDLDYAREMIDDVLRRTSGRNVKFVMTCKSASLSHLLRDRDSVPSRLSQQVFEINDSKGYLLTAFEDQQFQRVLNRYRILYGFEGWFEDRVLADCKRSPFLLRMMFEVASSKKLTNLTYSSIDFFHEYLRLVCGRFERPETIQDLLSRIAGALFSRNAETISIQELRADLGLPTADSIPESIFVNDILTWASDALTTLVGFYFPIVRDFIIAFSHLKLDKMSEQELADQLATMRTTGVHSDVIQLCYTFASKAQKRLMDGDVHDNALAFVEHYQAVLDENFKDIKHSFEPFTPAKIGLVGYFDLINKVIPAFGFRAVEEAEEPVLLLPQGENVDPDKSMLAFINGVRTVHWRPNLNGFRSAVDFNSEILWHDIGPALDKITLKGLLDESKSRTLLMERTFATAVQYYDEIMQLARFKSSGSYEPVTLDGLRHVLLYKRSRRIIERKCLYAKLRRGELNLVARQGGIGYSGGLEAREWELVNRSAYRIASKGKFFHPPDKLSPGSNHDYIESRLYDDIGLLESMGVRRLEVPVQMSITEYESLLNSQDNLPAGLELLGSLYGQFLEEYRMLVESSLPTLRNYLPSYGTMPVTCFLRLERVGETSKMTLTFCRDEHHDSNRVIVCSRKDFLKVDRQRGFVSFGGKEHFLFGEMSGDLYSLFFRAFGRPKYCYSPYLMDGKLTPVRNLVYTKIREELRHAFWDFAKQLGASPSFGSDLFSREPPDPFM